VQGPAPMQIQGQGPVQFQAPFIPQTPGMTPGPVLIQAPGGFAAPGAMQAPVYVQERPPTASYAGSAVVVNPSVHSYGGLTYAGNSVLISGPMGFRPNMNGTVYAHPAFPGRNLFWNQDEARWCYQDDSSSTGWRFVPYEIFIPRP